MAISKFVIALFLSLLVLHQLEAIQTNQLQTNMAISASPVKIDCGGACATRCKMSSRPNLCKRACGTCCNRCNCVPPGTYGNYHTCPCYAQMTTKNNKPKCP